MYFHCPHDLLWKYEFTLSSKVNHSVINVLLFFIIFKMAVYLPNNVFFVSSLKHTTEIVPSPKISVLFPRFSSPSFPLLLLHKLLGERTVLPSSLFSSSVLGPAPRLYNFSRTG